jgi:hypothetical protein
LRAQALLLALVAVASLTACATPGSTSAPAPKKITAKAGDTSLCMVVSVGDFARVTGAAATQVTPGTTADGLTGLPEVYCVYTDASHAQQVVGRGTINFERASDAQTATSVFNRVKQSFTAVSDVSGVGDAAFSGTPGGTDAGTGLIVVKQSLLLYLSVGGDAQTVTRVARQLALLVLSRVD